MSEPASVRRVKHLAVTIRRINSTVHRTQTLENNYTNSLNKFDSTQNTKARKRVYE